MASYCIPKSSCSTHRSSWINGDHPTSLYATVTTTVCMHWGSDCCAVSYSVDITRCDGYYVYKLQKPTGCYARYCGVLGEYSKKILLWEVFNVCVCLITCKKIYPPCYKSKSFPSPVHCHMDSIIWKITCHSMALLYLCSNFYHFLE